MIRSETDCEQEHLYGLVAGLDLKYSSNPELAALEQLQGLGLDQALGLCFHTMLKHPRKTITELSNLQKRHATHRNIQYASSR